MNSDVIAETGKYETLDASKRHKTNNEDHRTPWHSDTYVVELNARVGITT